MHLSQHAPKRRKRLRPHLPAGTSPGTLVADPQAPKPVLSVIAYGPDQVVERKVASVEELAAVRKLQPMVWLNVDGLGDADLVLAIGQVFGLHRIALEDVLGARERAKVETFDDHMFIVARMVEWCGRLETDQLSLFLGRDFVVTFQEKAGDNFDRVRERLRGGRGLLRKSGPDYLAYALLDAVVDEYYPVLETYGERIEDLEDELLLSPHPGALQLVHTLKRDLLTLRRAIWPLREAINGLLRDEHAFIRAETRFYLKDCYDHTIQVMDLVETYREISSGLTELYLSSLSNRLNEVMKVLTIIATIFIPLTFVAGIYGMNFDPDSSPWNMPELRWRYGYPASLLLMGSVAGVLLWWFRRRGWLGSRARPESPPRERRTDP